MKKYPFTFLVSLICVSFLQLTLPSAVQATEINSQLVKQATGADSIVIGAVVDLYSFYDGDHNNIYTSIEILSQEYLKGDLNQTRLFLTIRGGQVGDIQECVSDVPNFEQNEKVVIFLMENAASTTFGSSLSLNPANSQAYSLYGGKDSKLTVHGNKVNDLELNDFKHLIGNILNGSTISPAVFQFPSAAITAPYLIKPYVWLHPPSPVITFRVNENIPDCTGEGAAVQTAASTWGSAGALFSFAYAGPTSAISSSLDGVNDISWNYLGAGDTVGVTTTWHNVSTGYLVEFDIEFNSYHWWSTASNPTYPYFDVQTIALHELGHAVGLADLYNSSDSAAVMYGYGTPGTKRRTLTADDISGIKAIYGTTLPAFAPSVTNLAGPSNISSTTARLNGELTSTGGQTTTVHIYWGSFDGGTNPSLWSHDINLGVKPTGVFSADINGLTQRTMYYYRCYAVNLTGGIWTGSSSFSTPSTTVPLTCSYSANGSGGIPSAPMLTFTTAGIQNTVALSTAAQVFPADYGTSWSITNPLYSSTSEERWQTNQATSGIANSPVTINFVFYHQYSVKFGFTVYGGGSGYSPPNGTCNQFGQQVSTSIGSQIWADTSQFSYPDSLTGSSLSERWSASLFSGSITSSNTIDIRYYHQYSITGSFQVVGGGTPNAPAFLSTAFTLPLSTLLTNQPQAIWVDSGSGFSFTNPITGSSSGERWATRSEPASATSASIIAVNYYHQYLSGIYSVIGGGVPTPPTLNYIQLGSKVASPLSQPVWVDAGSTYTLSNQIMGNSPTERWSVSPDSGSVTSPTSISANYYHQYQSTVSYSIAGGKTPGDPTLSTTAFGSPLSLTITAQPDTFWVDADASYSLPNPLVVSTSTERWNSAAFIGGKFTSSMVIAPVYVHQYFVTVSAEPAEGGTLSAQNGWYDAGSTLPVQASEQSGWKLTSWTGSGRGAYSGENPIAALVINGPLFETATFFPGLTVVAPDNMAILYSYGTTSGSIHPGSTNTVFAPKGTSIRLLAESKLFVFSFTGWSGASSSNEAGITLAMNKPQSITANEQINYGVVSLLGLGALALVGMVIFLAGYKPKVKTL